MSTAVAEEGAWGAGVITARRLWAVQEGAEVPSGPQQAQARKPWALSSLKGRLVELCQGEASAALSMAFGLVLEAQQQGEPVAFVSAREDLFFPPDAEEAGVDLGALPVVRLSDPVLAARAADRLLRSQAFGLVVLDLGARARLSPAMAARLLQLALAHDAAVVLLSERRAEDASLDGLVALRARVGRVALGGGGFACRLEVLKDKRQGPGWQHEEVCRGPLGLR